MSQVGNSTNENIQLERRVSKGTLVPLTAEQLREQYHKDYHERQLRKQKLQELIDKENSFYERLKMRLRKLCETILYNKNAEANLS